MKYTVERTFGKPINLTAFNLFIEDIDDMQELEYWEERLEKMEQDFTVAYKTIKSGKVLYSIFCNTSKKGSIFK